MSIFDPLGFLANLLVFGKILLQDVWRSGISWDEALRDEEYGKWLIWTKQIIQIEDIRIPRYYFHGLNPEGPLQLHIFVDASECAFAAVAYVRYPIKNTFRCTIIGAKTKVSPLKPISIPRMELQGALLGARLSRSIIESHSIKFDEKFFWTDSQNVLCWLRSDQRRYKQYIAYRIGEIQELTETTEWRWVSTKLNVADEATKWNKIPDLSSAGRWYNGPAFLVESSANWPVTNKTALLQDDEELRGCHHITDTKQNNIPHLEIDFGRFSRWKHLVNTVSTIYRAIAKFKSVKYGEPIIKTRHDYSEKAKILLFKQAQGENFGQEVEGLLKSGCVNKSSSLFKLSPHLDEENVIRMRGRIDAGNASFETKRPIILPNHHQVTFLIMMSYHLAYHHHNHETVINEFRQKYYTSHARALLKRIRGQCNMCKIQRASPAAPEMADLPPARLASYIRPFTYVGVDYFGPMTIAIGRRNEKRWGVLFTCLTIRAVHIEVAHSMSTDSCILCLRNFQARRGTPAEIYCDNGTNFHGAERTLREQWQAIKWETADIPTKWFFNPPASPHMGGCWERLVRSIKRALYSILPTRNPTDEVLRSALLEAENIVNSRPLTYIPLEAFEDEALTPNHFLLGSSNGVKTAAEQGDRGLRDNWKKAQILADHFWRRWIREYMPTLTRRTRWFKKVEPIKEGDVVILVDPGSPRNTWQKGRILRTIEGSEGQVRQAEVQTATGILKRPATRIAVLDVRIN